MPQLRQMLDQDSQVALESVKYMSDKPEAVEAMTRTQLYLHMDIRERMLRDRYGKEWRKHFDAEFGEKRALWAAARDYHEAQKQMRRSR